MCRESLRYFYVLTNSFGSGREAASSPQIRQLSLFISSFKLLAHQRKTTKSAEARLSCARWNAAPMPVRYRPGIAEPAGGTGSPRSRGVGGRAVHPRPTPLPRTPTCSCSCVCNHAGFSTRVKGQNLASPRPDSPCHEEAFACLNQRRQTKEIQASHLLLLLGNS